MLTEEEAKTKWCPHARDWLMENNGSSAAINRYNTPDGVVFAKCIASECMAWRWGNVDETDATDPMGLPAEDSRTGCDVKYIGENSPRRFLPRKGYCGLAGKP